MGYFLETGNTSEYRVNSRYWQRLSNQEQGKSDTDGTSYGI